MKGPNLHPGALEPVHPGDRWLILGRGDSQPWVGVTLRPRHRGLWSVKIESSSVKCTVDRSQLVRRLGPAPFPGPEQMRLDEVGRELRALRREVARLAETMDKFAEDRTQGGESD